MITVCLAQVMLDQSWSVEVFGRSESNGLGSRRIRYAVSAKDAGLIRKAISTSFVSLLFNDLGTELRILMLPQP